MLCAHIVSLKAPVEQAEVFNQSSSTNYGPSRWRYLDPVGVASGLCKLNEGKTFTIVDYVVTTGPEQA